jgi:Zn-dependent protease with chaperone function
MLGCGCQKLNGKMNLFAFEKQEFLVPQTTGFIAELFRSHPRLTKRVIALKYARLFD